MSNDRNLIPAWVMNASIWILDRSGIADLLAMAAATVLIALGAEYE